MKKCMLLLAGYPATGKSYMCGKILERFPYYVSINQDELKEAMWDEHGFDNLAEKTHCEMMAWEKYYQFIDEAMEKGKYVISDYPFSDKQKNRLNSLAAKHGYTIITIRMVGDLEFLYQISRKRDLDQKRHLGHIVSKYHKGDVMENRSQADCLVTYDIFMDRCLHKGYDCFQLGHLIEVDVTDRSKIDFSGILNQIENFMKD